MFTLIYTEAGEAKRFSLPAGETVVGRSTQSDLTINDQTISRHHARFAVAGSVCVVHDMGSRNGILRNNELINGVPVGDGDVLVLGGLALRIEVSAADQLAFSENHALLELPGTIFRPIQGGAESDASVTVAAVADPERLLRLMSDVARTLVRSLPLSEMLEQVVDLAFDTIPAERAFLILREPDGGLVPRVVRTRAKPDGKADAKATSISSTIVNRVLQERVAILASDAHMDASFQASQSIMMQSIRSFMCVPLWNQSEVTGILYVDTPKSKRFGAADLDLFTALSNYAAVAIEQARLGARVVEEQRRRERLQRYHSPGVVGRILESGDDAEAPFITQERELTVLFADIVGFTRMSEGMPPAEVAQMLNTYLGRMSDVIFEQEGTLDKFIGDAILAVFGAPLDQPDHAERAVRTAQQMRRALVRLNAEREHPIQMRLAINSGIALAGDMGSPKRREYTVLGDVVNTASRLEKLCKPGQILISDATFSRLKGLVECRSCGRVELRGRLADLEVYEVVDELAATDPITIGAASGS